MSGVNATASEATSRKERERDRVAWNLPRRPARAQADAPSEPEKALTPPTKRAEPDAASRASMRIGRGLRARIRRWFGLGRSGLRAPHGAR